MEKKYTVVVEKGQSGYYLASVKELPGCYSQGKTIAKLKENIKEAIELHLEAINHACCKKHNSEIKLDEIVLKV